MMFGGKTSPEVSVRILSQPRMDTNKYEKNSVARISCSFVSIRG